MSQISVDCTLAYNAVSQSTFVFRIASAATEHQVVQSETLDLTPQIPYEWFELGEPGYRSVRLTAQPGEFSLRYAATVDLRPELDPPAQLDEVAHKALPAEVLPYLNPSRYCESDRLGRFACKEFGHLTTGYSRVDAICDWVNQQVDYIAGSTNASSSACDVLIQRAGVCRDFAHVAITLCRSLGIPARYVAGYAAGLEPPDFHGFFEAYLEESWYLFDATRMAPVGGLVRIAVGRDAADTPFASIVGQAVLKNMTVAAQASQQGSVSAPNAAVSTA